MTLSTKTPRYLELAILKLSSEPSVPVANSLAKISNEIV